MTSTVFVDYVTPVPAAWLNDVNVVTYTVLGSGGVAPTTPAQVISNLGVLTVASAATTYNPLLATFTTGGTTTAFTLTPTPATPSLVVGQRYRVQFNATPGATPTLSVSGLAAHSLNYYDSTGTKVAVSSTSVVANMISDVEYDGVDYVVLDSIKADGAGNIAQAFHASNLDVVSINSGQISGFRNGFINGAYQVNQIYNPTNAATGSAVTVTAGVTHAVGAVCAIDNWYTECTGQNITAQQIAGTAPFKYAYKLLSGATGPTTTLHGTRIEGKDCVKDVNQTKGISLWMTHDVARTVTWTAYYANTEDTFSAKTQIATGTITATAARAQYFFSFNAGANAGTGLCIEYTTGALTNSTGYVIYEGHQNERVSSGATAGTSYEHVDYAVVLPRCQRYLPLWGANGVLSSISSGSAGSAVQGVGYLQFPVQTRVVPTGIVISASNPLSLSTTAAYVISGLALSAPNVYGVVIYGTISGATAGQAGTLIWNNTAGQLYFTGAQL